MSAKKEGEKGGIISEKEISWNNLDSTLKTAKTISALKFYLKNKLISDFLNSTS